jgi:hypothetical protein
LPCTKISSKCNKDLNARSEILKLLQEKALEETDISNNLLSRTPTAQEIRAMIDRWDCTKLKSFCTAKET